MDAAAISSIVTGSVAIVAALTGAGVTGFFNHRNTKATLVAAHRTTELQWVRTRKKEHEAWLRDNRQEAYVAFLNEAASLQLRIGFWPREALPYETLSKFHTDRTRLSIIGGPEVRVEAGNVSEAVAALFIARENLFRAENLKDADSRGPAKARLDEAIADWKSAGKALTDAIPVFNEAVRKEMGTSTPR